MQLSSLGHKHPRYCGSHEPKAYTVPWYHPARGALCHFGQSSRRRRSLVGLSAPWKPRAEVTLNTSWTHPGDSLCHFPWTVDTPRCSVPGHGPRSLFGSSEVQGVDGRPRRARRLPSVWVYQQPAHPPLRLSSSLVGPLCIHRFLLFSCVTTRGKVIRFFASSFSFSPTIPCSYSRWDQAYFKPGASFASLSFSVTHRIETEETST